MCLCWTEWRIAEEDLSINDQRFGKGGQGAVHRARWAHIDVMVKRCLRGGNRGSLQREGRMLTSLSHPKVVRVYGVCVSPIPMER